MFNTKEGTQMKALNDFVAQYNSWDAKFFKSPALDLTVAKDRQRLAEVIDSRLSPENLSCDGELPMSQVRARYAQLTRVAAQLQKLDPTVKFYEYA
jgi:hypothetical protein